MNPNEIGPIIKDDEIDLLALVKTIWAGRKTIYYAVGAAILIGLVVAFASPAKYTAKATLLPSDEKKTGGMGNLSALAGMAGKEALLVALRQARGMAFAAMMGCEGVRLEVA